MGIAVTLTMILTCDYCKAPLRFNGPWRHDCLIQPGKYSYGCTGCGIRFNASTEETKAHIKAGGLVSHGAKLLTTADIRKAYKAQITAHVKQIKWELEQIQKVLSLLK